jgi:hypothetical protein
MRVKIAADPRDIEDVVAEQLNLAQQLELAIAMRDKLRYYAIAIIAGLFSAQVIAAENSKVGPKQDVDRRNFTVTEEQRRSKASMYQ